MKNKKSKAKLILGAIFLIIFLVDFINVLKSSDIQELLNDNPEEIGSLLGAIIVVLLIALVQFSFVLIIYFIIKRVNKRVRKEKLTTIDVSGSKEYFRGLVNDYNPAVLSFIDDFELLYPKDICVMLLEMKKRKYIDFDIANEKIILLNSDIDDEILEYIYSNIQNGKVSKLNTYKIKSMIESNAFKNKLLKESSFHFQYSKVIGYIVYLIILSFFVFNEIEYLDFSNHLIFSIILVGALILWIVSFIFATWYPIYLIIYFIKMANNRYERSELGEEINIKLEGLKIYLKDFSSLDEKTVSDIIIWEDYLIYSVLFNQNKKIIDEMYDKYFTK